MENLFDSKKNLENLIEFLKEKICDDISCPVWTQYSFARICSILNTIYELQIMLSGSDE